MWWPMSTRCSTSICRVRKRPDGRGPFLSSQDTHAVIDGMVPSGGHVSDDGDGDGRRIGLSCGVIVFDCGESSRRPGGGRSPGPVTPAGVDLGALLPGSQPAPL